MPLWPVPEPPLAVFTLMSPPEQAVEPLDWPWPDWPLPPPVLPAVVLVAVVPAALVLVLVTTLTDCVAPDDAVEVFGWQALSAAVAPSAIAPIVNLRVKTPLLMVLDQLSILEVRFARALRSVETRQHPNG
jgi:hypothetical protein